jgi:hypothetical protein
MSTRDHILNIRQLQKEKWERSAGVYHPFRDFKKGYVSVRREVLYGIHNEYIIARKIVGKVKMCLIETYSTEH